MALTHPNITSQWISEPISYPGNKNMQFKEDIPYLKQWEANIGNYLNRIKEQAKTSGLPSAFTIASTSKVTEYRHPYLTPIRRVPHGIVGGAVVFSQTQASLLCRAIDGEVNYVLVDAEKKIDVLVDVDQEALRAFHLPIPDKLKTYSHVELGNLSASCAQMITQSEFQEFKPNDLTVEAAWHFLSQYFRVLSGRQIGIIGSGNIGFKLGLKLVESGSQVQMVRRDLSKGMLMANAINIVKPLSTISSAQYNASPLHAALFCDALVGCTDGTPVITWEMIQSLKPGGIVIDIGKGSVFEDAIQQASAHNIQIVRCDISPALDGLIATMQKSRQIMANNIGRAEIRDSIYVVSGGYLGNAGDIVVDNFQNPSQIIGVCDGRGDFKQHLTDQDKANLKIVENGIQNDN